MKTLLSLILLMGICSFLNAQNNNVGSSEHFEFYTNIEGEENYFAAIKDTLEEKYLVYTSLWDRHGQSSIFPTESKIKINYCHREDIPFFNENTPRWRAGGIDLNDNLIYITPFVYTEQTNYYTDLTSLVINELAQRALLGKLRRDGDYFFQPWFFEGFGLYEMGYRPSRNDLLEKLSELGTQEPQIDNISNISELNVPGNKDLVASLFESKILINCYFYFQSYNDLYEWWQLLKHYYVKDNDRIQKIHSSENFNFYAAEKEIPNIEEMASDMEEQFELQKNRFNVSINHKINLCIYDVETGLEITDRTDFQALAEGADKINTMPIQVGDYGILHHEFMHVMVNFICRIGYVNNIPLPGSFLNEGLASSTDAFQNNEEMMAQSYKIQDLFYHYQRKYSREPTFLEIIDNTEQFVEDPFWVDSYGLGAMFWRYMNDKYPNDFWSKVKMFLQNGRDWSAFGGMSIEEEGEEYISFLKKTNYITPSDTLQDIPFNESFNSFSNGWCKPSLSSPDNWQIDDGGMNGTNCAKFYTNSDKNQVIESWLISPALNTKNIEQLKLSFDFGRYGENIELDVFFTNQFNGNTDETNWTLVKSVAMPLSWDWSKTGEITINNPSDTTYIGLRKKSPGEQHLQLFIDNFNVTGTITNTQEITNIENDLRIYPNPISSESVISFQIKASGDAELSIYDIRGRKIFTLLNEKLNAGKHSVPFLNLLPASGVYFCKLQTLQGVSTKKLIVNAK